MIEVIMQSDGRWAVQFTSEVGRTQEIVHRAIRLTEALRVVRLKLERDMMGIEASAQIREMNPTLNTDEEHAAAMALLEEMSDAVDRIDIGLDEEIRVRRAAQYVYRVPRNQTWAAQP